MNPCYVIRESRLHSLKKEGGVSMVENNELVGWWDSSLLSADRYPLTGFLPAGWDSLVG